MVPIRMLAEIEAYCFPGFAGWRPYFWKA